MLRSQRKKEIIWCIFQEFNRIKTSVHRNLLVQIKPRGSPHRLWIGCIRMWWRWWKGSKCCRVSEQTSGRSWGTETTPLKAEEQRIVETSPPKLSGEEGQESREPECWSWWASKTFRSLSSALKARMVHRPWRDEDRWEKTGLRAAERNKNWLALKRFSWNAWSERLDVLVDSRRLMSRDVCR